MDWSNLNKPQRKSLGMIIKSSSPRSTDSSPRSTDNSPRSELRSPRLSNHKTVAIKKLRLIGTGGSGSEVWTVKIEGWLCCAKIVDLSERKIKDIETFEKEIEILQTLPSQNKHILQYLGFQRVDNILHIFMTLYEGNLHQIIEEKNKSNSPFGCRQVANIAYQILSAISVLHTRRLIHRDIKSMNIFYERTADDIIYVIGDFGESKFIPKNKTSTLTGTSRWMAPEILKGEGYSFEADIWAFGMLLYELMSLEIPYYDIRFGIEDKILKHDLPLLNNYQENEYAELIDLWESCLITNPKQRLKAEKGMHMLKIMLDENIV